MMNGCLHQDAVLDYFDPAARPIEWFMRCRLCGAMTAPCATSHEATLKHAAGAKFATEHPKELAR